MALGSNSTTRRAPAKRTEKGEPRRGAKAPRGTNQSPRPQIRIMFRKAIAMGPGKADLLRAIEQSGSISAAARELGMSYRRAWLLVDTMNQCFRSPLVETLTGGQHGGGARVTDLGHDVLRRYLEMEAKAAESVQRELDEFCRLMSGLKP
jgi:molybdate transport system regulatory protein